MTERLTKEREKEIRDWALSETVRSVNPHLAEVIAELDAVRETLDAAESLFVDLLVQYADPRIDEFLETLRKLE